LSCGGDLYVPEDDDNKTLALGLGLGSLFIVVAIFALVFYNKSQKLKGELQLIRKSEAVDT